MMTGFRAGRNWLAMGAILVAALGGGRCLAAGSGPGDESILDLSLEDLLNIEVTSVSRRPQAMHDAAAAIFVVTGADIEQMGATSIPDALRRVPGLHVARIDANKWAITSRGFNGRFSNKLLVLVDGRSVYTSSFSGVYWEVQDLMLEDVDRIEVIRGPGSTLWGANAVNGVINIITKQASDTQGGVAVAGAGDFERGFAAARWGGKLAPDTYARVYGKAFDRGEFRRLDSNDAGDDWQMYRGGFRFDRQPAAADALTLQGDIYNGTINQRSTMALLSAPYSRILDQDVADVSGGNLLGHWSRRVSDESGFSFQTYFDRAVRREAVADEATTQFDYDFQHHFATGSQKIIWGLGYHYTNDIIKASEVNLRTDGERSFTLYSGFIQDEFDLWHDRLALTVGSKVEHNDFTGVEIQPSARFMWRAHPHHRLWAAVSRAVRTPSRIEDELEILTVTLPPNSPANPAPLPVGIFVSGSDNFDSEDLMAYELGYRFSTPGVTVDLTAFYNDYTHLQGNEMGGTEIRYLENPPYIAQRLVFNNKGSAENHGFEAALTWQARDWLRWDAAYSFMDQERAGSSGGSELNDLSPRNQVVLSFDLRPVPAVTVNAALRYVDPSAARGTGNAADRSVPSYNTIDVRIGWRFHRDLELSLVGQNLADEQHQEYLAESFTLPTAVPRSFYAKIRWDF